MIYVIKMFFLYFLLQTFIVSNLTFRSLAHFEIIFVYGVRRYSNFFSFTYSYPAFPIPLIEETVQSPLYILASLS